ncbi:MAG: hypothetical protein ACRDP1_02425 [Nocardioidaceae bacterium]
MSACLDCGQPGVTTRCATCTRTAAGTTTSRGYGHTHQQLRRQWAPLVAAGTVRCWRCGQQLLPHEPWDLGHDDHDRQLYAGPEHRACNRATSRPR